MLVQYQGINLKPSIIYVIKYKLKTFENIFKCSYKLKKIIIIEIKLYIIICCELILHLSK